MDLHGGQMIAVTGRTGSGKSTLLRILAGFLLPQEGAVSWRGTALDGVGPEQVTRLRRGFLGFLDQEAPVVDGLAVLEAITVGAGPLRRCERAEARRRATRLARRLGLELVLERDVRTLSGGERQRVGLAGLIIARPRVLLLDEPTSALDEATTHRVIAHLRELVDSGVGILTATHDPLLIEAADTVMPLH
ncbi:ATP-binding cassette domain-containing protein [Actinomyces capricornis]|uniref:Macrolide ABC transporter ATP-binding protein n=1 Tax=Actinomyces capricornis TaxID=2755559 RepID=A0ABM7U7X1_9ACTO|nr:ATP-binding cassette domain-containing protein [Actinomyces capricornis]BDA63516.1 macrolide ABC transporter ATP-binding protein [Actinomyces capricornis]